MADQSQKTEQATRKRIEKTRADGKFPTSREMVGGVQFLAVVSMIGSWGQSWLQRAENGVGSMLRLAFEPEFTAGHLARLYQAALADVFLPLLLAGAVLLAVTLSAQLLITGLGVSWKRLAPDWKKMNPIPRLGELPRQNLAAAGQLAAVIVLGLAALYHVASRHAEDLLQLPLAPLDSGLLQVFSSLSEFLWQCSYVFLLFGIIDFARQRLRYRRDLRMSKQDLRDEYKESEGNPATKARIRKLQRALQRRRMLRQVPAATAVIVNPTHYAVAIRYDLDSPGAPLVTAKGRNYLAARIRHLAITHNVPIVENPPLARALYKSVPLGAEIPTHLYRAVAEVLAYTYKTMRQFR